MPIYLDNNATTQADPRVVDGMLPYLQGPFANPSSLHRFGRAARDAVEEARGRVAALVGAQPGEVIFTSGGTEANNLALRGALPGGRRLLVSATEHAAVLEPAAELAREGVSVASLPVDAEGRLKLAEVRAELDAGGVGLASVMAANNETGVIQDLPSIADSVHAAGARLHSDAVQAAGKIPLTLELCGADLLTISSHKIYGPKGVGALIRKRDIDLRAQIVGGGQEGGLRGGTENVAAIVGFGIAADLARAELDQRMAVTGALRDRLESALATEPAVTMFSTKAPRLSNTAQFSISGYDGEALVMALDRKGVAVSSGSACHSSNADPSHVLLAMGMAHDVARGAIRVSFGKDNSEADVDALVAAITGLIRDIGQDAPGVRAF